MGLEQSIMLGSLENVRQIIRADRSLVNSRMGPGTPLHIAVHSGHIHVVTELLENGAIQLMNSEGITPLMLAADQGLTSIVRELLNNSTVGIDIQNPSSGDSALHHAVGKGHETTVKELLRRGAKLDSQNRLGFTPIRFACQEGYTVIVEMLLNNGANPQLPDFSGFYPIHTAAQNNRAMTMKKLLHYGCDPDYVSRNYYLNNISKNVKYY